MHWLIFSLDDTFDMMTIPTISMIFCIEVLLLIPDIHWWLMMMEVIGEIIVYSQRMINEMREAYYSVYVYIDMEEMYSEKWY